MHSRLPIAVPPAHHETAGSYVQRLATLHGLPLPELWEQVSHPRRPGSTSRLVALDRLAAVTGHPASRLARAVIDLRRPEPDWLAYRHTPQPGCPRCTPATAAASGCNCWPTTTTSAPATSCGSGRPTHCSTGHHTWPTCPRSSSRSAPTCACCTATAPQPPTMPC